MGTSSADRSPGIGNKMCIGLVVRGRSVCLKTVVKASVAELRGRGEGGVVGGRGGLRADHVGPGSGGGAPEAGALWDDVMRLLENSENLVRAGLQQEIEGSCKLRDRGESSKRSLFTGLRKLAKYRTMPWAVPASEGSHWRVLAQQELRPLGEGLACGDLQGGSHTLPSAFHWPRPTGSMGVSAWGPAGLGGQGVELEVHLDTIPCSPLTYI